MALWFLLTLMLLVMCQPSVNTTVQNAVPYIGADIHSQDWSSLNSNSDQFIAMPLMSVFWRLDPQHFFPKIKEAAKEVQPLSHLVLTFQQSMLQLAKWRTSDTQGWLDSIGGGVSEKCISDIEYSLAGLIERKPWALNMMDAAGKPSPDLRMLNLNWVGSYQECLAIDSTNSSNNVTRFSGKYCTAVMVVQNASIQNPLGVFVQEGLCVPDSCNEAELSTLFSKALSSVDIDMPVYGVCQEKLTTLDGLAVTAIVLLVLLMTIIVLGTTVDVIHIWRPIWPFGLSIKPSPNQCSVDACNDDDDDDSPLITSQSEEVVLPGPITRFLVSFSLYTNGCKLLSTNKKAGTLDCVHGIRFITMTWVILGHCYFFATETLPSNLFRFVSDALDRWTFQTVANATFSVDTYFVLSGLLVSYLSLKELNSGQKISSYKFWIYFYLRRIWRLTPTYMLIILVYTSLGPYMGHGPQWSKHYFDRDNCRTYWWTNLLYINNFFNTTNLCLQQSWYLSNDMQFYILSPLVIASFYWSSLYGAVSSSVLLLVTVVTPAAITLKYHLPAGQIAKMNFDVVPGHDYINSLYFKPYCRMGPYIVGLVAGYLLCRTNCRYRLSRIVNTVCWMVASVMALSVLYGLYNSSHGDPMSLSVAALYNAVSRTVWGLAVAWVIFACVTGNGGFVNSILSFRALVPLSRLTYVAYLIHVPVLNIYLQSRDSVFFYNTSNIVMLYLAVVPLTYMASVAFSLCFESPVLALGSLIFQRRIH